MRSVVTIAGSDSSGGAGIQADIKTIEALGAFAQSVICALTAQNTMQVTDIMDVPPDFIKAQLDAVFSDIVPDAVKIGMVSAPDAISVIAERLYYYNAQNIVVDPVMVATSGAVLVSKDAIDALCTHLFPRAHLITPNLQEAQMLLGRSLETDEHMEEAARELAKRYKVPFLVKWGHRQDECIDILALPKKDNVIRFIKPRIDNPNTHGTGCTLSSAIATMLAHDLDLESAIRDAKAYINGALESHLDLGKGRGPLNHMWKFYSS